MIADHDRERILAIATKYGAKRVLIFGSSLAADREARDIDVAVQGVAPSDFFRLYSELIFALPKPVDLVDLDSDTPFSRMVAEEGVPIHG